MLTVCVSVLLFLYDTYLLCYSNMKYRNNPPPALLLLPMCEISSNIHAQEELNSVYCLFVLLLWRKGFENVENSSLSKVSSENGKTQPFLVVYILNTSSIQNSYSERWQTNTTQNDKGSVYYCYYYISSSLCLCHFRFFFFSTERKITAEWIFGFLH